MTTTRLIDRELHAGHTAESVALLARLGVLPPAIVVGIPSGGNTTRSRDYTPPALWRESDVRTSQNGGARFLNFLQAELIPRVEADYRTSRPRMLAGWSRGGHFILYSQIAAGGRT